MSSAAYKAGLSARKTLSRSRILSGIGNAASAAASMPARAVGTVSAPFLRSGVSSIGDMLLGVKAKRGVMAGRRVRPASKKSVDGGNTPITKSEYADILAGRTRGEAHTATVNGRKLYYKTRFERGGLVGAAKKHPLITAGVGAAAYLGAKSPEARAAGGAFASQARPNTDIDPYTLAMLRGRAGANPLSRDRW